MHWLPSKYQTPILEHSLSYLWHYHSHTSLLHYLKCLSPWAHSSPHHLHLPMRSQSSQHLNLHVRHTRTMRTFETSCVLRMDKSPLAKHPNHSLLHLRLPPRLASLLYSLHHNHPETLMILVMISVTSYPKSLVGSPDWRRCSLGFKTTIVGLERDLLLSSNMRTALHMVTYHQIHGVELSAMIHSPRWGLAP